MIALTELQALFIPNYDTGELYYAKNSNNNTHHYGDVAGSYAKYKRYFTVKINGKNNQISRILYQMYHNLQYLPDCIFIDHIDGNTKNNNISNLRIANKFTNRHNTKLHTSNNTSHRNITIKHDRKVTYYRVCLCTYGNKIEKLFEYSEAGLQEAIKYRDSICKNLRGKYNRE